MSNENEGERSEYQSAAETTAIGGIAGAAIALVAWLFGKHG